MGNNAPNSGRIFQNFTRLGKSKMKKQFYESLFNGLIPVKQTIGQGAQIQAIVARTMRGYRAGEKITFLRTQLVRESSVKNGFIYVTQIKPEAEL
ncbi:MAG: hypothetical protein GY696_25080 [Gammaproteobacteria bacterium]|nr:hypothetical protein [Gammaproteobacteria bacterium]